jgi:hypothetical protein
MARLSPEIESVLEVVRGLEKERECPIWCMTHCNYGHICSPTMWSVYKDRHKVGNGEKLELLLHSGGGHPDIAFKVMKFFRRRFKTVNAIVPLRAKSAATLMCLGADKIYMGELAELGPVDIQLDDAYEHGDKSFSPLDEFKSMEFLRESSIEGMDFYASLMNAQYGVSIKEGLEAAIPLMAELMKPIFGQIDPIKMGGYRRAIAIGEEYAKRMLALTGNPKAPEIVQKMVWEYPSHDFCIDFEEARVLGLPVERLPEAQDHKISAALLMVGRGDYHGFVSHESSPAPKSVRRNRGRAASRHRINGKPNGRERHGPEERI